MESSFVEKAKTLALEGLKDHIRVFRELSDQSSTVVSIAEMMIQALRAGRKILAFGNGGSAADAQHLVGELIGRFYYDRVPLSAIALTTNTSSLTAWGRMSMVDTKPFMLPVLQHRISVHRPQVTRIPARPGGAADCRRSRCIP